MKIAVVYNRASRRVINPLGPQNLEKYGRKNVKRIVDALKAGKHQVAAFEGDKDLIDNLEEFMPRVVHGERPGMVFNVAYGIQGQARYTHVPGILEMIGIPYVGSGPLAHSLSLDKVVAKTIFQQSGIPTPDFAVLEEPDGPPPDIPFPLIVKPRNEAVSFGLRIVHDEDELREAAGVIFEKFQQSVLVEEYVDGRELNVGLIGNDPTEALPPVELLFGEGGPRVYTYEDKAKGGGRVTPSCPADIGPERTEEAKSLAIRAFKALGCYDCARVDFRMREDGSLTILEINSLPSLGGRGSYVHAAEVAGMDFAALTNRLVEVASQRYFGTPAPPTLAVEGEPAETVFSYITQNRDKLERHIKSWVQVSSRSSDPVGLSGATTRLGRELREIGLSFVEELSNNHAYTWQTKAGLDGGTLFVLHLDVPVAEGVVHEGFRREPEWLLGEGIGSSRAPLVTLEYALRGLRHVRKLHKKRIGVLVYTDEGRDARYSSGVVQRAAERAGEVLVLRPGNATERVINARRGQRKYRFVVEGSPRRPGQASKRPELFRWATQRLDAMGALSSREERVAVSVVDMRVETFPLHLPHRIAAEVLLTYPDPATAEAVDARMRSLLGKEGYRWTLEPITDRPPMIDRKENKALRKRLESVAGWWTVPLKAESSLWPSVAGLVAPPTPVVCGLGPPATDLHTPREAVQRIALMQRTLLLAQYLLERREP